MKRAHETGRFGRAVELVHRDGGVTQIGARQFRVVGHDEPEYFVDLDESPACYCDDIRHAGWRTNNTCKHILASRLAIKDPSLMNDLMEHAYRQQQLAKDAERSTKRRKAS